MLLLYIAKQLCEMGPIFTSLSAPQKNIILQIKNKTRKKKQEILANVSDQEFLLLLLLRFFYNITTRALSL